MDPRSRPSPPYQGETAICVLSEHAIRDIAKHGAWYGREPRGCFGISDHLSIRGGTIAAPTLSGARRLSVLKVSRMLPCEVGDPPTPQMVRGAGVAAGVCVVP